MKTGEGLDEWFNYIVNSEKLGRRIVEVDYDTYAMVKRYLVG